MQLGVAPQDGGQHPDQGDAVGVRRARVRRRVVLAEVQHQGGQVPGRLEPKGGQCRGQARRDVGQRRVRRAADDLAQHGGQQEVGHGRGLRRGLDPDDVPLARRQGVQDFVHQP